MDNMEKLYKIIHPVKYYRDYLKQQIRPDGREFLQFRTLAINADSIGTADGSAIVKIGNTTVVCGIKAELCEPKAIDPDKGFFVPNIEFSPLCSQKYRPGAPGEDAQVTSQALYDIITNSKCVDLKELCIVKEKLAWVLYCDLVCLDHDGSVLDAAVTAMVVALKTLKLPNVDYDMDTTICDVSDITHPIDVKSLPVAASFMIFDDDALIADPTSEEENLSNATITVAVCDSELCFVHKPGGCPLSAEQIEKCLLQTIAREKTVNKLLNEVIKK